MFAAAGVAWLAWRAARPTLARGVAVLALAAVAALCGCTGQSRRLRSGVPRAFVGFVGGLLWLDFDLVGSSINGPSRTAGTVFAQLAASGAGLVAASLALAAAVRAAARTWPFIG